MATRVRKLAKELRQSPAQVLGLLHAVGFTRYKSPEDMVSDAVIRRLRKAIREGVRAEPLPLEDSAPKPPPVRAAGRAELMDQVVTGALRGQQADALGLSVEALAGSPAIATPEPAPRVAAPPPPADDAELRALEARLASERAEWADEKAGLEQALAEAREALAAVDGVTLADLLAERGLRGRDEQERALLALASRRQLGDLLGALHVADPAALRRRLETEVVLVGGAVPDAMAATVATVEVAPDRAEVPGGAALDRALRKVWEQALLGGITRITLVGGQAMGHKLLAASADPRVAFRSVPARTRTAAEAEGDMAGGGLVVVWGVDVDAAARAVYAEASPPAAVVDGADIGRLLAAIVEALVSA